MSAISEPTFITELKKLLDTSDLIESDDVGKGYILLLSFVKQEIIPLVIQKEATISVVELTTCGLISDLLTSQSGASNYYLFGITPYNTSMKIKFGVSENLLKHDGPGTVSIQTAEALASIVRMYSGSIIGIAETGMLPSNLESRRTIKEAGECYFAISTATKTISKKLLIQKDLSRSSMRQNIAWEILKELKYYLNTYSLP